MLTISVPNGKPKPKQARRTHIHAVAERATDPGAKKYDQVKHKPPTAARVRL